MDCVHNNGQYSKIEHLFSPLYWTNNKILFSDVFSGCMSIVSVLIKRMAIISLHQRHLWHLIGNMLGQV